MNPLAACLQSHDFTRLFVDELGWDHCPHRPAFRVADFECSYVAAKRGLVVLRIDMDRLTIAHRGALRKIQLAISRIHAEHILIAVCQKPHRQAWLWAVRRAAGGRYRHRDHPFFSDRPPEALLRRIGQLRIAVDEESTLTLTEAIARVRAVLDVSPEQRMFHRFPNLARRGDELARAAKAGGIAERNALIEFHMRLIRWAAKRWAPRYGIEYDDAVQLAALGAIRAAERFEPERGFQFSTYAQWWMRQMIQRDAPQLISTVRLPTYLYDECRRIGRSLCRLQERGHSDRIRLDPVEQLADQPKLQRGWRGYAAATQIETLSDRAILRKAQRLVAQTSHRLDNDDESRRLRIILDSLDPRHALVLQMRYGLEGECQTLLQVGDRLGITRERARQIQVQALQRMRRRLDMIVPESRQPLSAVRKASKKMLFSRNRLPARLGRNSRSPIPQSPTS